MSWKPTLSLRICCGVLCAALALAVDAAVETGSGDLPVSGAVAAEVPVPATAPAAKVATAPGGYPAAAVGQGATVNGYNPVRWAEDWQRMRDPGQRRDFIDRLKYLPLGRPDVYLTLSGELRGRINHTEHAQLRGGEQRQDIYRVFVGSDLHLGPHLRLYAELGRGVIEGRNIGTPSGSLRNDLFLQQRFADWTDHFGNVEVGVRYGRQVFIDGPNLLVAARDNNTLHFTVNGLRTWINGERLRADLFDFDFNRLGNGGIDDDHSDRDRRFSGITGGIVLPRTWLDSKLQLDPFLWRQRQRNATWGELSAREERYYGGLRLWGEIGTATLDWTVNHQWGDHDGRRLEAWQALFAQNWRLGEGRGAPRLGFHADYASGGGAYGGRTLRNASAPYGNNIYYAYGLFLTPTNLAAIAPNLVLSPLASVRVTLEYQWTWRVDRDDAVYRANGTAYAGTAGAGGSHTADVARLQVVWTVTPRLSLTTRLEHLEAGSALERGGYRSSNFAAVFASYRF